jgi:polar amino acid transport system substrate-binding protein
MRWLLFLMLTMVVPAGEAVAQSLAIYCEDDPPNQMVGPEGRLTGMTVEILVELKKRTGNSDPIQMVPWARGYDALLKKPGTVLFSVSRTPERNLLFHWIGPVLESSYSFYARADSKLKIKDLEEAKQVQRIGVYLNDVRDTYLTGMGFRNLDRTNNNIQNFKKLMAGRIDMYASAPLAIEDEAKAAGYRGSDVKPLFSFLRIQLYIAMSLGTPESVVKGWSEAFGSMQNDGSFARIHRKYYPALPLPGKATTSF